MALTNRQTAVGAAGNLTVSLSITSGSGNNRIAVLMGMQSRTPPNLATPTIDGVAPTGTINAYTDGTLTVVGYYWTDSALPASGGSYTAGFAAGAGTNIYVSALSWSGAKQQIPADIKTVTTTTQTNTSFSLTADAGSEAVAQLRCPTVTPTNNSGQTSLLAVANFAVAYDSADLNIGWTHASSSVTALAFAIEPAAAGSGLTITSVNTTNTAFSAQTDSAVVGTGLSASVVCTYAGIACTNESASSSTSLKITFPNFFTNNIKLGRNYEFKVVG
jgi:hypothetical protein